MKRFCLSNRDKIGHQTLVAKLIVSGDNDGILYGVESNQCHFNLSSFNPVASDFYLEISTSQMLKAPIWAETTQIAG